MSIKKITTLVGGEEKELGVIQFTEDGYPCNIAEILDEIGAKWEIVWRSFNPHNKERSGYAFLHRDHYFKDKEENRCWGVVWVTHGDSQNPDTNPIFCQSFCIEACPYTYREATKRLKHYFIYSSLASIMNKKREEY